LAIFEVLTAFSASLAIAIPTFMAKVMRPKYEERFEEFRKARRQTFFDEFEDASRKIRQITEEIAPETVEAMENLFGEWRQLKSDENRLKKLLFMRKFFYVGWFRAR
jgi:ABC-type transport system involved in cytochrome bd biosynthesis fused ATPase/permease subunit